MGSNRPTVQTALRNLETASAQVTNLLGEVQSGRGLAVALLKDDVLARNVNQVDADLPAFSGQANRAVSNLNPLTLNAPLVMRNLKVILGDGQQFANNGATLMSNLNAYGLFYKPKPPKPTNAAPVAPLLTPRLKSQLH